LVVCEAVATAALVSPITEMSCVEESAIKFISQNRRGARRYSVPVQCVAMASFSLAFLATYPTIHPVSLMPDSRYASAEHASDGSVRAPTCLRNRAYRIFTHAPPDSL
jgi:hypothetical protein